MRPSSTAFLVLLACCSLTHAQSKPLERAWEYPTREAYPQAVVVDQTGKEHLFVALKSGGLAVLKLNGAAAPKEAARVPINQLGKLDVMHLTQRGNLLFLALGDLFAIWGQRLAPRRLLSFIGRVRAFRNGREWRGDPRRMPLARHDEIRRAANLVADDDRQARRHRLVDDEAPGLLVSARQDQAVGRRTDRQRRGSVGAGQEADGVGVGVRGRGMVARMTARGRGVKGNPGRGRNRH